MSTYERTRDSQRCLVSFANSRVHLQPVAPSNCRSLESMFHLPTANILFCSKPNQIDPSSISFQTHQHLSPPIEHELLIILLIVMFMNSLFVRRFVGHFSLSQKSERNKVYKRCKANRKEKNKSVRVFLFFFQSNTKLLSEDL